MRDDCAGCLGRMILPWLLCWTPWSDNFPKCVFFSVSFPLSPRRLLCRMPCPKHFPMCALVSFFVSHMLFFAGCFGRIIFFQYAFIFSILHLSLAWCLLLSSLDGSFAVGLRAFCTWCLFVDVLAELFWNICTFIFFHWSPKWRFSGVSRWMPWLCHSGICVFAVVCLICLHGCMSFSLSSSWFAC